MQRFCTQNLTLCSCCCCCCFLYVCVLMSQLLLPLNKFLLLYLLDVASASAFTVHTVLNSDYSNSCEILVKCSRSNLAFKKSKKHFLVKKYSKLFFHSDHEFSSLLKNFFNQKSVKVIRRIEKMQKKTSEGQLPQSCSANLWLSLVLYQILPHILRILNSKTEPTFSWIN